MPTNFTDAYVDGVPIIPGLGQLWKPWARHWWVDANNGLDGNSGKSRNEARKTIDGIFDLATGSSEGLLSGDVIHLIGRFREQITTPAGLFDITMMGASDITRHPDSHAALETYGGSRMTRWDAPASPTASTPLVKVQQQGWKFVNILFTGDEDDSVGCIQLFRDAGSGNSERDASHAMIVGCRFQAGLYGIQDSGGCARIKIYGNEFLLFSVSDNDAITNVTGAGVGTVWGWEIVGNKFHANYSDIDLASTGTIITHNHFVRVSLGVTNTIAIDMTGSTEEVVSKNWMHSASDLSSSINARFTDSSSTTAYWGPNYYSDKEEYAEPAE